MNEEKVTSQSEIKTREAPTEIRLLPIGPNETLFGTFNLDKDTAQAIVTDWNARGVDCSFDYEHAANSKVPVEAPAAGWYQLELREDGIYAVNIKWTDKAKKYIEGAEYRYISPTFYHDEDGNVTRFFNASLTNVPGTYQIEPMVAASENASAHLLKGKVMDVVEMKKKLIEELSSMIDKMLSEVSGKSDESEAPSEPVVDSPEEEASELAAKPEEKSMEECACASENPVGCACKGAMEGEKVKDKLQKLTGKSDTEEAFGVLYAFKDAYEELSKNTEELAKLSAIREETKVREMADTAVRDGRLPVAKREWALSLNAAQLGSYLEAMPVIRPGAAVKADKEPSRTSDEGQADHVRSLFSDL